MKTSTSISIVLALGLAGMASIYGYRWYGNEYRPAQLAKESVLEKLNDPASAQFRNVVVVDSGNVCGEVNAKNRMGGYVGFVPFVVLGDSVLFDRDGVKMTDIFCSKPGA